MEAPYEGLGQFFTFWYFLYYLLVPVCQGLWDRVLFINWLLAQGGFLF